MLTEEEFELRLNHYVKNNAGYYDERNNRSGMKKYRIEQMRETFRLLNNKSEEYLSLHQVLGVVRLMEQSIRRDIYNRDENGECLEVAELRESEVIKKLLPIHTSDGATSHGHGAMIIGFNAMHGVKLTHGNVWQIGINQGKLIEFYVSPLSLWSRLTASAPVEIWSNA
jgi:hypothetical protein